MGMDTALARSPVRWPRHLRRCSTTSTRSTVYYEGRRHMKGERWGLHGQEEIADLSLLSVCVCASTRSLFLQYASGLTRFAWACLSLSPCLSIRTYVRRYVTKRKGALCLASPPPSPSPLFSSHIARTSSTVKEERRRRTQQLFFSHLPLLLQCSYFAQSSFFPALISFPLFLNSC